MGRSWASKLEKLRLLGLAVVWVDDASGNDRAERLLHAHVQVLHGGLWNDAVPTGGGVWSGGNKDADHRLRKPSLHAGAEHAGHKTQGIDPIAGVLNQNNPPKPGAVIPQHGFQNLLEGLVNRAGQRDPGQGALTEIQQPTANDVAGHQADQQDAQQGDQQSHRQVDQLLQQRVEGVERVELLGTEVRKLTTKRVTNVANQMVVASGMTTSKPAIRSFFRSCCNRTLTGGSDRERD